MNCEIYTTYTFEVSKTIEVTVNGKDTDVNYEKALKEAVYQIKHDADEDWIQECTDTKTDYEGEEDE